MRVKILKAIDNILDEKFKEMLYNGAFPEVHAVIKKKEDGRLFLCSYYLFEFSNTWSRFVKFVDHRMKQEKIGDINGVFTRKHSAKLLSQIKELVDTVTEDDVTEHPERFRSFADDILDSM
jgi:hypothetical protein